MYLNLYFVIKKESSIECVAQQTQINLQNFIKKLKGHEEFTKGELVKIQSQFSKYKMDWLFEASPYSENIRFIVSV